MNTVTKSTSLFLRLGVTAMALLLGQQAFAVGTAATTPINNTAIVSYSVATVAQTDIPSSPSGNSSPTGGVPTSFVVDNRVNFTLVTQDAAQVPIELSEADIVTEFLLTNLGNSVQDFVLSTTDLPIGALDPFPLGGPPGPNTDTTAVGALQALTAYVDDGDGIWEPAPSTDDAALFADELAADASVTIWVSATGPATGVTGDIANIQLDATVHDGGSAGGAPGALTTDDGGIADTNGLEVVLANGVGAGPGIGDGVEDAQSGYTVVAATLSIQKTSEVISDPFNGPIGPGVFPKAIPDAVIEYTVLVTNSGTIVVTDVSISDLLQEADVTLVFGDYSGEDIQISVSGGATTTCLADAVATDGCTFLDTGAPIGEDTLTMGRPGAGGLTIPVGEAATILYRVTIN